MGDYVKRRTVETVVKRVVEQPQQPVIDLTALANAVASAVTANMPQQQAMGRYAPIQEGQEAEGFKFDNSRTLEQLAENMLVQRGNKDSNFKGLGNTKTTEKDQKEVDKTIDLLSGLDD